MRRNVTLYPWYFAGSAFLAWLPIFFLYFSQYLDLKDILLLEAIYYISVVVLEVPTGYFSDVLGRKITLLIGSLFLCIAISCFLLGHSFWPFVFGQLAFAGFMSFHSGTDTVFHYESLKAIDRESEYGDREALANKWAMLMGGAAAIAGGTLGSWNMKASYALSLVTAVITLAIALNFKEPIRVIREEKALPINAQLLKSMSYIRLSPIGWIFAYYVFSFIMIHIPYEFYQPYLRLLEEGGLLGTMKAPFVSGILFASSLFLGAYAAGQSMMWKRRMGLLPLLLISLLVIVVIILFMGWILHPVIIGLILLRGMPWAAIKAPVNEVITPVIGTGQRATFHSLMSLACRLGFFLTLFVLSFLIESDQPVVWSNLSTILRISAFLGILVFLLLWWRAPDVDRNKPVN